MSQAAAAPRAPYKLFDYYDLEDRGLFFGREEEVARTVGEVLSRRLLVLFAPSGSGKRSLINAGVRPKLEERGFATVTVRLGWCSRHGRRGHLRASSEWIDRPHTAIILAVVEVFGKQFGRAGSASRGKDQGVPER